MKKSNFCLIISICFSIVFSFLYYKIADISNLLCVLSVFIEFFSLIYFFLRIKEILRQKKLYKIIYIIVPLAMLILQFAWSDESIYYFYLLYIYISLCGLTLSKIFKQNLSFTLPLAIFLNIILAFVFGIFGVLFIFKYAYLLIFLLAILYNIFNHKEIENSNFNDEIFFIFSLLFLFAILGSYNRFVHVYDEFSLWAHDIKYILHYDCFGNSTYPPILTLWQYIVSMFSGFHDFNVYFGNAFFVNTCLLILLNFINEKNKKFKYLILIVLFNSFYLIGDVYNYTTIYADLAIGVLFLNCFLFNNVFKRKNKEFYFYFIISITILTLIKPQGFMFSFTIILFDYLRNLVDKGIFDLKIIDCIKNMFVEMKKYIKIAVFVLALFVAWSIYRGYIFVPASNSYDFTVLSDSLRSNLSLKFNIHFIAKFTLSFLNAFDSKIFNNFLELTWFQFIVIYFTSLYFIFYKQVNNYKIAIKKIIPYVVSYFFLIFLTILSQFVMFSVYEASILASFGRYVNSLNFVYVVFLLLLLIEEKFLNSKSAIKFSIFVYVIILLFIPFTNITYFISDYKNRVKTSEFKYEKEDEFKIINDLTDEDSRIFVLDQSDKDGIMAMWYARYYLFPRYTNSSSSAIAWKIKTKENADDLQNWGLTYEKLLVHLQDYNFDYLFLYSTDIYLNNYLKNDIVNFNSISQLEDKVLLKIIHNEDNIKFELVEEVK